MDTAGGGTLNIGGSIGGDVTVIGGTLVLNSATALSSGAIVTLPESPNASQLNLAFSGTQTISALNFGSTSMAPGTYGSLTSSAGNKNAAFGGNGILNVAGSVASDSYWDPSPALANYPGAGGSGSWDNTVSYDWFTGNAGVDTLWAASTIANFAGVPGIVTLNDNIAADQIIFTTDGYSIGEGSGSPVLTLGGSSPTITVPGGTATIGCTLAGSGVTFAGSGTLVLSGTNTFTTATINPGSTVQLDNVSAANGSSGTITDNGTLNVAIVGNNATLATAISGPGIVNIMETPADNLQLGGVMSSFSGAINCPASGGGTAKAQILTTTVALPSAATINVAAGGTFYLANNGVNIPGPVNLYGLGNTETYGALRIESGATVSGPVTLFGNTTIGSGAGTGTISGAIGDGGHGYGITKTSNAGIIQLLGLNTFSGGITINGSTLTIGGTGDLGDSGGSGSYAGAIANTGTFIYNSSAAQTLSGVMSGTGALEQTGAGTLTLTAANTYSGATTIGSGSTLTVSGIGQLGNGSYAGNITDSGTLNFNVSVVQILSGVISGPGVLIQNGSSTLTLKGANTYSGGTTINSGILEGNTAGSIAGNVTVNATGALQMDVPTAMSAGASLTLPSSPSSAANLNYSGTQPILALNFGQIPQATGTWGSTSSTATYKNAAFNSSTSGLLSVVSMVNYWDPSPNSIDAYPGYGGPGTWETAASWWNGSADAGWTTGNTATFAGAAGGTVTLGNPETADGLTFTTSGYTLSGNTLTLSGPLPAITVPTAGAVAIACVITGSAGLTENGVGTLTLSAANTFTGGISINGGALTMSGSGDLGDNGSDVGSFAGAIVDNGAFTYSSSAPQTLSGVISGTGTLTQNGPGELILNNAGNSYTGNLTINGAVLDVPTSHPLGNGASGTLITFTVGGTLENDDTTAGDNFALPGYTLVMGTGGGVFSTPTSSQVLLATNLISGTGSLTKTGPGEVRLFIAAGNTFSGGLIVSGGVLTGGQSTDPINNTIFGAIPSSTKANAITIQNGSELRLVGGSSIALGATEGITLGAGGGCIDAISGLKFTIPSVIAGTTALTINAGLSGLDTGEVILSGANTYGGGTTVSAGTLDINATGSVLGNVTVNAGTFEMDNATALASTASLSVATGAVVNLTYSGNQNINALYVGGIQQPPGIYGTANNPSGVFTAANGGTVTVGSGPPVTISAAINGANQLVITWNSLAGGNYNVYTTPSLNPPATWTKVNSSPIPATGSTTSYIVPGTVSGNLFVTVMQ